MSIAGKPIAGCSPIAAASCRLPSHAIAYWENQSVVYGFGLEQHFEIPWFIVQPASEVFPLVLTGGDIGYAECVQVPPHDNVAYAWPDYTNAAVPPLQRCPKEAA